MRRRTLLTLSSLAAATPRGVGAQGAARRWRLGSLHASPWNAAHHVAFREALASLGMVEGRNIASDPQGHGLRPDGFASHAAELARRGADAIHVTGDAAIEAALAATRQIPILALADDLVGRGFAAGFAQPGGNVTGISILASDLDGKRQDLLLEAVPAARRIGTLADAAHTPPVRLEALRAAAAQRGVEVDMRRVGAPEEIAPAIAALHAAGAQAVNVLASPLLFAHRAGIIAGLRDLRLPAVYQWPDMAREGGLIAYGPSLIQLYRDRIPQMLVRLLHGTPPARMPIEIPTHFGLVANLRTARSLGLVLPDALLARAEEVIE